MGTIKILIGVTGLGVAYYVVSGENPVKQLVKGVTNGLAGGATEAVTEQFTNSPNNVLYGTFGEVINSDSPGASAYNVVHENIPNTFDYITGRLNTNSLGTDIYNWIHD